MHAIRHYDKIIALGPDMIGTLTRFWSEHSNNPIFLLLFLFIDNDSCWTVIFLYNHGKNICIRTSVKFVIFLPLCNRAQLNSPQGQGGNAEHSERPLRWKSHPPQYKAHCLETAALYRGIAYSIPFLHPAKPCVLTLTRRRKWSNFPPPLCAIHKGLVRHI